MEWTIISKSEEEELVESMRKRRNLVNPEVGSFFYDIDNHKLILVDSMPMKYCPTNGGGRKTTDKLHEDVWYESEKDGDFKDCPRGRVFYDVKKQKFELMLGDWAKNITEEVLNNVKKRFHLENESVEVGFADHWNIGEGFEGRGYDY